MKNIKLKKGMTLIEALIWFFLAATVLVVIFMTYNSSRDENLSQDANKEIGIIFANGNALYQSSGTDSFGLSEETAGIDVTASMLQMGIFPKSLKLKDGELNNRFGGPVKFINRATGFVLVYSNVPTGKICLNLVDKQKKIGWDFAVVGNFARVEYDNSYLISKAATACKGENGIKTGTIMLQFANCVGC